MTSLAPLVIAKRLDASGDTSINQSIADARTARAGVRAKHVACVGLQRPGPASRVMLQPADAHVRAPAANRAG